MGNTPRLNLKKPAGLEYVNVADLNENSDKIDAAVGAVEDKATTHLADMASQELGKGASLVGVHDAGNLFTSTTVEGALKEAITQANAAFTSASNGKSAVSAAITGVDPKVVVPADPSFAQLATAIGQIETGKKWASGIASFNAETFTVDGLPFEPQLIFVRDNKNSQTAPSHAVYYSTSYGVTNFYRGTAGGAQTNGFSVKKNGDYYSFTCMTTGMLTPLPFKAEWIAIGK